MPIVISRHQTAIAYGSTLAPHPALHPEKPAVATIKPGSTPVTDAQLADLANDESFVDHARRGFLTVVVAPVPPSAEDTVMTVTTDPARARVDGESENAYVKRMRRAGLEPLPLPGSADARFIAEFFAMTMADQDAYYLAMGPDEKDLVDRNRPLKA